MIRFCLTIIKNGSLYDCNMKKDFKNIIELVEYFKTEEIFVSFLKSVIWKNGKKCPHCGSCEIMEYKNYKRNRCKACKKDFSIKQGTIFQYSNIPLKKWFMAMYIFNAHKKGISSCQLARDISVSQKTAWFMLQRLRYASKNLSYNGKFSGTTEIDEAYLGGSETNKHADKKNKTEKTCIIGLVNRDTKTVKAYKVSSNEKENLLPKIYLNCKDKSNIFTDSYSGYDDLKKHYNHEFVKHCAGEYNRDKKDDSGRTAYKINTNSIEGFWSQLKRGINGTYHWVSKKHVNKYLDEFSFRYNSRDKSDIDRFKMFCHHLNGKLLYNDLIA